MEDQGQSLEMLLQKLKSQHNLEDPASEHPAAAPPASVPVSHTDEWRDLSPQEAQHSAEKQSNRNAPDHGKTTATATERSSATAMDAPRQVLPSAIGSIVSAHVSLKNRRALEEMRDHRGQLLRQLRAVTGLDPTNAIVRVEEDLRAIEEGLEQLKPPPGTLPENEWH